MSPFPFLGVIFYAILAFALWPLCLGYVITILADSVKAGTITTAIIIAIVVAFAIAFPLAATTIFFWTALISVGLALLIWMFDQL